jgi:hypothetical protein
MKERVLIYSLAVSVLIHVAAIPLIFTLASVSSLRQNGIVVNLIDVPQRQEKKDPVAVAKPGPKAEAKIPKPAPQPAPAPRDILKAEEPQPKKDAAEKPAAASLLPGDGAPSATSEVPGKGRGAGDFLGGGDMAVMPGAGLGKGGSGRGEGTPGQADPNRQSLVPADGAAHGARSRCDAESFCGRRRTSDEGRSGQKRRRSFRR